MIINCVGDITGYGKTLIELYNQLPSGEFWALGDIVDRGPNSKLALDFLIDNNHKAVMGNHDHMMLFSQIKFNKGVNPTLYHPMDWHDNGGFATLQSFDHTIDKKYFDFINELPLLQFKGGTLQMTHAPLVNHYDTDIYDLDELNKGWEKLRESVLWNRYPPKKIKGLFQVYGHNSSKGILWHTDKNPHGSYSDIVPDDAWGCCIDTWREGYLTALSIDTAKLPTIDDPNLKVSDAIKIFKQRIIE